ncbi:MAG: hypothetical protein JKX71_09775 [Amylibacter sp.]|nr:hypothetical protein [Amylibacter sp.]
MDEIKGITYKMLTNACLYIVGRGRWYNMSDAHLFPAQNDAKYFAIKHFDQEGN